MTSTPTFAGGMEVRTSPADLCDVEDSWRRLALSEYGTSYFGSPDWVLSWWETIGQHVEGQVAVWLDGPDAVRAVLPLARSWHRLHPRVPVAVRCLTNLGSGQGAADHYGFAVHPEAADGVRRWLERAGRTHPLLLNDLDPHSGGPLAPPGALVVSQRPCPRLVIPSTGAGGSAKLQKQLRSYQRRLASQGVRFRWLPPGRVGARVLDSLFALHAHRSAHAGRRSTFGDARRPLHDRLVARSRDGFGPAALVAERGGDTVGVLYGFRWRDVFAYYQSGWVPELAAHNLGTVLVAEAIAAARADGARVFDFLRGTDAYKYRFGAIDRTDSTFLVPHGLTGRMLQLKFRAHLTGQERGSRAVSGAAGATDVAMTGSPS